MSHLQSCPSKVGQPGCLEMSVINYRSMQRVTSRFCKSTECLGKYVMLSILKQPSHFGLSHSHRCS